MKSDDAWVAEARGAAERVATRLLGEGATPVTHWDALLDVVLARASAADWSAPHWELRGVAGDCEAVGAYAAEGLAVWCDRVEAADRCVSRYWKRALVEGFIP